MNAEQIFKAIRRHNWNHAEFVLLLAAVGGRADEMSPSLSGMDEVSECLTKAEVAMDHVYALDADDALAALEEMRQGERV